MMTVEQIATAIELALYRVADRHQQSDFGKLLREVAEEFALIQKNQTNNDR
jgi:hypothetical protein